jgi:hypothetical protein
MDKNAVPSEAAAPIARAGATLSRRRAIKAFV